MHRKKKQAPGIRFLSVGIVLALIIRLGTPATLADGVSTAEAASTATLNTPADLLRSGVQKYRARITIATSFRIGTALEDSDAAKTVANAFLYLTHGWGPAAAMSAVYLIVSILTVLITNNAAAALMFPFLYGDG
ncbi:MAG: hypothetical protein O2931_18175 [Planctomycetota bacterium]|nr:hypothetical protein [Planctomycetota bacterium]